MSDMNLVDAIGFLIDAAVKHRNTLGPEQLHESERITSAAIVAGEHVAEWRHADEMTAAMEADAHLYEREPLTCSKCQDLKGLRAARLALDGVGADDEETAIAADKISQDIGELVVLLMHDEAMGCDHDAEDNFTTTLEALDDGPDERY